MADSRLLHSAESVLNLFRYLLHITHTDHSVSQAYIVRQNGTTESRLQQLSCLGDCGHLPWKDLEGALRQLELLFSGNLFSFKPPRVSPLPHSPHMIPSASLPGFLLCVLRPPSSQVPRLPPISYKPGNRWRGFRQLPSKENPCRRLLLEAPRGNSRNID